MLIARGIDLERAHDALWALLKLLLLFVLMQLALLPLEVFVLGSEVVEVCLSAGVLLPLGAFCAAVCSSNARRSSAADAM